MPQNTYISWHKGNGKWRDRIKINGKSMEVGYFDNIADAEKAVINARNEFMPFSNEKAI